MPISVARLRELIALAGQEGVGSIDLVEDGTRVRIERTGAGPARAVLAAPAASSEPEAAAAHGDDVLAAPMFGVFHLTPAPGAPPFARLGERVTEGQTLCLIEAMKMFVAVPCDRDGRLEAILAEPGREVASGQPLFRIAEA